MEKNNKENFEQNIEEKINPNSQKTKNKKSGQILLILLIISVLMCGGIFWANSTKNNQNQIANNNIDNIEENRNNEFSKNQLLLDFQNEKITADEYVKFNLYAKYDKSLLDNVYPELPDMNIIHTDELVKTYYNELSQDTLNYYWDKINLADVTFELDKENTDSGVNETIISDLLNNKVYAKGEKVTNLNNAILSSKGNFVVWYTTSGDSATDYNAAKKIAEGMEALIEKYDNIFGSKYKYESEILSKGQKYKKQKETLENLKIDSKYLESAMQIYLVEYDSTAIASYIAGYGALREVLNQIGGGDVHGSIAFPYILIKPSAYSDFERLEQIYSHEMFHHYQYNILSNQEIGKDQYILDATANLASALVVNKTNEKGFLNEWAGTARIFSSDLLSEEWAKTYGISNVGYSLFVYMYNYSTIVENGTSKIIKSIYEDDSLKYLQENSTGTERKEIQKNIALNNLSQTYTNKNLIVDKDFNSTVTIQKTITDNIEVKDKKISKIGIDYYKLSGDANSSFEITLKGTNKNYGKIHAYVIGEKNGNFEIVDSEPYFLSENTLHPINCEEYNNLYLAIANKELTEELNYSFKVSKGDKIETKNIGEYYEKCFVDGEEYRLYFDIPEGFIYTRDSKWITGAISKEINGQKTNIFYSLEEDSTFYDGKNLQLQKEFFYEDVEINDYENAMWQDEKTITIDDKQIKYAKGTYTSNGNTGVLYSDGNDLYSVIDENKKGIDEIKIHAEYKITGANKEWVIDIDIYSDTSANLTDEELLRMAVNTNFVVEKVKQTTNTNKDTN